MNRLKSIGLLMMIAFISSLAIGQEPINAEQKDGPVISVESDTYDYGTIEQGSNGDCQITITNTGNETLIISKCKGSCGCTVPLCPVEPVLPGESAVINISYNTNRVGPITKKVTITSNAINSNTNTGLGYELYIRGNVKAKPVGGAPIQRGTPAN